MVSRVAQPHDRTRAETPLRRPRTTKTAPAVPLRHERHLRRAHWEDAARGRATGGALRGERSDELHAREDELRMAERTPRFLKTCVLGNLGERTGRVRLIELCHHERHVARMLRRHGRSGAATGTATRGVCVLEHCASRGAARAACCALVMPSRCSRAGTCARTSRRGASGACATHHRANCAPRSPRGSIQANRR